MSHYAADATGYLEDLGHLARARAWARTQEPVIRAFFANGVTDQPAELAAALSRVEMPDDARVVLTQLMNLARKADEILVISHGA